MLKVLILSHRFYPEVGGIETNSEILAAAFQNAGAEVHLLTWTVNSNEDKFIFRVIRNPGIFTILKEHRWADVVFENNPCLRLSWVNLVIRRPLVIALNTWVNRVGGNKNVRDKLKNLWFGRADAVIAVSEALRRKEWEQAIVIENPYNSHLFRKKPDFGKKIPFIFLGRLVSDKGADMAIKAVEELVKKNLLDKNLLQLTITGDGPELKKLIAMRKKYGLCGTIHFTGVLKGDDLVDCLNRHRFILVPSVWEEPYGNVVLEGMACGCIPVASNGGGIPEAVGNAGIVFKRRDLGEMVKVLEEVLLNNRLIENIQYNAEAHLQKHSLELVAAQYFQILKKVSKR